MPAASLLLVAIAALACLAPTATAQGERLPAPLGSMCTCGARQTVLLARRHSTRTPTPVLPPPGAGSGTYTIKAGETFRDVAQAKGFTVDAILAANPGVVPEKLQVGQVVKLPCLSGGAVGTQAQRERISG